MYTLETQSQQTEKSKDMAITQALSTARKHNIEQRCIAFFASSDYCADNINEIKDISHKRDQDI